MTASSAYAIAYEGSLLSTLKEYADKHANDAADSYAAVREALDKGAQGNVGWYGETGPFGYMVAWKADGIIEAEFRTYLSILIRDGLDRMVEQGLEPVDSDAKVITADDVYNQVEGACRQAVRKGITSSSSGRFHNPVAQSVGNAADDITNGSFQMELSRQWAHMRAKDAADRAVTPDELLAKRYAIKSTIRDLSAKLNRATSATSKEKLQKLIDGDESRLRNVEARIEEAIRVGKWESYGRARTLTSR